MADFQVLLATNKNLFSQNLKAESSCPKYTVLRSLSPQICVWTILCLLSYFVKFGRYSQCAGKKYTNCWKHSDEKVIIAQVCTEIEDFFRIEHYLSILQACTGIEDFGIALHHLEEANWVLMVSFPKS